MKKINCMTLLTVLVFLYYCFFSFINTEDFLVSRFKLSLKNVDITEPHTHQDLYTR